MLITPSFEELPISIVPNFKLSVATLTLGLRPKQGLAKLAGQE